MIHMILIKLNIRPDMPIPTIIALTYWFGSIATKPQTPFSIKDANTPIRPIAHNVSIHEISASSEWIKIGIQIKHAVSPKYPNKVLCNNEMYSSMKKPMNMNVNIGAFRASGSTNAGFLSSNLKIKKSSDVSKLDIGSRTDIPNRIEIM